MEQEYKEYWLSDIETGYRYRVTKEQHESYMKMWDECYPKIDSTKCVPMLYGTGGDIEGQGSDWSKWFYKNNEDELDNTK